MEMPNFRLKKLVCDWLTSQDQETVADDMYFRLYDPQQDHIVDSYSSSDWNLIFKGYNEEDMRDLQECVNVIILLWCDRITGAAHGMVFLEEPHDHLGTLNFHGGTWDHSPRWFVKIYHSLTLLFQYLVSIDAQIYTTCDIKNIRADKFQKSLGFVEYEQSETLSYKKLDEKRFLDSPITRRFV